MTPNIMYITISVISLLILITVFLIMLLCKVNKKLNGITSDYLSKELETLKESVEDKIQTCRDITHEDTRFIESSTKEGINYLEKSFDSSLNFINDSINNIESSTKEGIRSLEDSLKYNIDTVHGISNKIEYIDVITDEIRSLRSLFTNVKIRGTIGETLLEDSLTDFLTPNQFVRNFSPKNNTERVEFALKVPCGNKELYIPLDSKFPITDYEKYIESVKRRASKEEREKCLKRVEKALISCAQDIKNKYINPPITTDFAYLYIPSESIYQDIMTMDSIYEDFRKNSVIPVSPCTLTASLSALRTAFSYLTINNEALNIHNKIEEFRKLDSEMTEAISSIKKGIVSSLKYVREMEDYEETLRVFLNELKC